jgi:2-polyprenyl-6-methoxyphenol hydroxylase-like FAD-dependent oxidoreductase
MANVPVLIIGAGPTGMTAALELSRHGVPVRLIEKALEPATTSRAIGVQARTLELFNQRGIVQPLLDQGNPAGAGSIYGEGKRIFQLEFSNNGSEYPYLLFVSQAETEAVLRGELDKHGVAIERGVEFVGLSQSEHGENVTVFLKNKDGGVEEVVCDYLVDCEGAHSISRSTMNVAFSGKTRSEDYVLGDLYIDGDLSSSDFHIFSSEHGFMGLFPLKDKRFRLIASHPLSKPSKDTAPSLEEIQEIYNQRSHIPARFHDMSWSSWFRINSRMAEKLQVGRVFLGGDSAHIHSPAGAQGMNTGIQDMINLGWKLAFVLQGKADPKLLETYSDDRIPVIRDVLSKTEGLTDAIGSENQLFRSVFSHLAPWIVNTETVQQNATERMSQLSLNYRESPLSVSKGGGGSGGSIHAGDRVPDLEVTVTGGHGQTVVEPRSAMLLELFNVDAFTLLFVNTADPSAMHSAMQEQMAPWKALLTGWSLKAAAGLEEKFSKAFGDAPRFVLVRPDGYAAFTGPQSSIGSLADYLGEWFPPVAKEASHG